MTLSALTVVNRDTNRTGAVALYELCDSERYRRVSFNDLAGDGLLFDISSGSLYSAGGGAALVMISSPFPGYEGSFLQMSSVGAGTNLVDNDLGAQGFDNVTTSMLLIGTNRGPETRLSFRAIFLDEWKVLLDDALAGTDVVANGDPLLTWKMFPSPSSVPLAPDLSYLHVFQALDVSVHVGPLITYHYPAGIGYYIFLYVDSKKRLKAFVAGYEVWVQGGFYHDDIVKALEPKIALGVATLDSKLAAKLAAFSGISLEDVYYLPGDQTRTPVPSVIVGSTFDDVTIVLERT